MAIYGVKFGESGKEYYFDGQNLKLNKNVCVIVETEKGLQYGKVLRKITDYDSENKDPLKKIIRLTTKEDYKQHLTNLKDADGALKNAQKIANDLQLDMRFLSSSFTFDRKQLLFNFTADERVDFRDKASSVGGIGQCGRELCCSSFLKTLESVSMNMAKNQNLALNPSKINGSCGRLLCCLAYEDSEYQKCGKGLPNVGDHVIMDKIDGKVISVDVLNRKIKVFCDNEIKEVDMNNESHQ